MNKVGASGAVAAATKDFLTAMNGAVTRGEAGGKVCREVFIGFPRLPGHHADDDTGADERGDERGERQRPRLHGCRLYARWSLRRLM